MHILMLFLLLIPVTVQATNLDEWYDRISRGEFRGSPPSPPPSFNMNTVSTPDTEVYDFLIESDIIDSVETDLIEDQNMDQVVEFSQPEPKTNTESDYVDYMMFGNQVTAVSESRWNQIRQLSLNNQATVAEYRDIVKVANQDSYPKAIEYLAYMYTVGQVVQPDLINAWLLYDVLYRMGITGAEEMRFRTWNKLDYRDQMMLNQHYERFQLTPGISIR